MNFTEKAICFQISLNVKLKPLKEFISDENGFFHYMRHCFNYVIIFQFYLFFNYFIFQYYFLCFNYYIIINFVIICITVSIISLEHISRKLFFPYKILYKYVFVCVYIILYFRLIFLSLFYTLLIYYILLITYIMIYALRCMYQRVKILILRIIDTVAPWMDSLLLSRYKLGQTRAGSDASRVCLDHEFAFTRENAIRLVTHERVAGIIIMLIRGNARERSWRCWNASEKSHHLRRWCTTKGVSPRDLDARLMRGW